MPDVQLWHWIAFGLLVTVLLALDLLVFHRHARTPSLAESTGWSVFWIGLAMAFNVLVWYWGGSEAGMMFLTGFLVEKSLSMDNLFVFAVIFGYFHVPLKYQYRVLFWGVLGAIVLRVIFITGGVALLHALEWVLCLFGAFLIYTGVKLLGSHGVTVEPEKNPVIRLARRFFRVSTEDHQQRFLARENGLLCITPLFLVLLLVESSDVLFAVDSVPAILGITKDPFIVITSNIFAILGLRALYFLLAGVIDRFRYLQYGLSAVLIFIGTKMIVEYSFEMKLPSLVSLLVIGILLAGSIAISILATGKHPQEDEEISELEEGVGCRVWEGLKIDH